MSKHHQFIVISESETRLDLRGCICDGFRALAAVSPGCLATAAALEDGAEPETDGPLNPTLGSRIC